jgi:hypothetical protein
MVGPVLTGNRPEAVPRRLRPLAVGDEVFRIDRLHPRPNRMPAGRPNAFLPTEPSHLLMQGVDARLLPSPVKGLDRLVDQRLDGGGQATCAQWRPSRAIDQRTRHRAGPVGPQELIEPRAPDPELSARLQYDRAAKPFLAGQPAKHDRSGHRLIPGGFIHCCLIARVRHGETSPPSNSTRIPALATRIPVIRLESNNELRT